MIRATTTFAASLKAWRRWLYRMRQFTRGLRPHLAPEEIEEVRSRLSSAELDLFLRAEPRDRRHSFDLYRLLQRETNGDADAAVAGDLLTAALLHDVGKGPLLVWHRITFVVLSALTPRLARRLEGRAELFREASVVERWRDALWRLRHHAALGAVLAEAAGASPRVVELIRRHTEAVPDDDPELAAFIVADDRV
jgi:hypothetical protein